MKRSFFDTTFGFALRLFGVMVLVNILALILSFVLSVADDFIGSFLTSFIIIGVGLLSMITSVYTTAWQKGFRDIGLVSRNLMTFKHISGFIACAIAVIPGLIAYIVLAVSKLSGAETLFGIARGAFMILHTFGFSLVSMLIDTGLTGVLLSAVFFIPLPFIAWFGYYMGYNNILITKIAMYGKDKPEKNI